MGLQGRKCKRACLLPCRPVQAPFCPVCSVVPPQHARPLLLWHLSSSFLPQAHCFLVSSGLVVGGLNPLPTTLLAA